MNVDVLAIGAHPDDIELACGGTVAALVQQGYKIALCDLTQGELGTRGTKRLEEKKLNKPQKFLALSHDGICKSRMETSK